MGDLRRRTVLQAVTTSCVLAGAGTLADDLIRSRHTDSPWSRALVDPAGVTAVHTSAPVVALTFDDGPDPRHTPQVLDVLARAGVTATFFVVGRNALAHPGLVRRIVGEGHEVANHTQDHLWLDRLGADEVRQQIVAGTASLRRAGAPPPRAFRPPRGWTSAEVARAAGGLGLRSVFWTDCLEARLHRGARTAADEVARGARPGSVLLLHDGGHLDGPNPQALDRGATVEALPHLLAGLRRRGLTPTSLRRLMPVPAPYQG
jgi:peptidoglycan/xylan/chitin deacetylase (PgdA/CDA1 family)